MITPERLARLFHDTYQEVISESGDWGRLHTGSMAWDDVPTMPRRLFEEVCKRILERIDDEHPPNRKPW